jgi:hypothetical protein
MEQSKLSFKLNPTNPEAKLGFETWINDHCVFDISHVDQPMLVNVNLPDDDVEAEHVLKLVLKHKQAEHTTISESGEILNDSCLKISGLKFDEIELGFNILQKAVYCHNFNGTSKTIEHKFFDTMGCNGTVELKFTTPIYLWLLEHM